LFGALSLLPAMAADGPQVPPAVPAAWSDAAQREALVRRLVDQRGLPEPAVRALLNEATFRQDIIDAISRPYEAKRWYQYRGLFLTDARIKGGAAFWQAHRELLQQAQAGYGVPPEIVVAIIGVETQYGRNL
jgi:membrane-bound lytic murein transglycosylase B